MDQKHLLEANPKMTSSLLAATATLSSARFLTPDIQWIATTRTNCNNSNHAQLSGLSHLTLTLRRLSL